jgi:hypothetical protein
MATMYETWQNYERAYLSVEGDNLSSATTYRAQIKQTMTQWAAQYTHDHPDITDMWNLLFEPMMGTYGIQARLVSLNG